MATQTAAHAPVYEAYKGNDPAAQKTLGAYKALGDEYKEIEAKLAAADGDKEKAVKAWYETADNPEAVKLRKAIEMAQVKLKELAEKHAVVITMTDDEKAKADKRKTELKEKIRAGFKAISDTAEMIGYDVEGVKKALEDIGDPTRSNRGRKPGEAGSSLPRASVIATVNGGQLKNAVYDTFSKVAAVLHCEPADLLTEFAKVAGVELKDVAKVDKPTEFTIQPNENGSVYTINTVPKPRAKPGRKPSTETAAPAVTESAPEDEKKSA